MKTFFKELFEYTDFYNQQLINKMLESSELLSDKSIQLLSHMVNAHQIWNSRIDKQEEPFGVWQLHTLGECKTIAEGNYAKSLAILNNYDLDKIILYKNSRGDSFERTVRDMLFHIINHTTYHRAQLATDFRNIGIEPLLTDYIFYKR